MVPYLARLGISHLYTSPLAEATAGSTHGYDVTDPRRVRAELGGEPALRRLWEALDAAGMGHGRRPGAQPHGHPRPLEPLVAGRAAQRSGQRRSPTTSTSTGSRPTRRPTGRSCCRSSTAPLDRRRRATAPSGSSGAPTPLDLVVVPPRRPVARLGGVARPARPRPRRLRRAGRRRARRPQPLARGAAARSSTPSTGGPCTGARRPGCSTGAASSTSPTWRRCAWSGPRCSTTSTRCCAPGSPTTSAGGSCRACGSTTSTAWSTPRATSSGSARWSVPTGCWWWRRSWPPTSGCPAPGRSTAPPATRWWPGSTRPLTDPVGAPELARLAHRATGLDDEWPELERECRRLVADRLLVPEVDRVARAARRRPGRRRRPGPRPTTPCASWWPAWRVELGVYRTYARPGADETADDADRVELDRAAAELARGPPCPTGRPRRRRSALLRPRAAAAARAPTTSVARFGQLTAPLAAKAVEDTAFYREVALPWLTEVGGDPGRPAWPPTRSHAACAGLHEQLARHASCPSPPTTPSAAATCGPACRGWRPTRPAPRRASSAWRAAAERHRSPVGPDPALERLLWRAIVGAWPVDADRIGRLRHQGDARGQAPHLVDRPRSGLRGRGAGRFVRGCSPTRPSSASVDEDVGRLLAPGRAAALVLVTLACHRRRLARPLPGRRGLEPGPRRPRQPPPDRPRPPRRAARPGRPTGPRPGRAVGPRRATDPDDDGLVKLARGTGSSACGPQHPLAFDGSPHARCRLDGHDRSGVLAFRRGDGVAVVVPGAARTPPRTGRAPARTVADVLSGARHERRPHRARRAARRAAGGGPGRGPDGI